MSALTLFLCMGAVVLFTGTGTAAKPHLLLMVLDDIGRADHGIYGGTNIPMPNLNSLAKNGVVLENLYTQTVCSPTRSSLLTGKYPFRFGMQHYTTQLPGMTAGVPLDVPMLPKLLADVGYERHMIGKWHCGYATWSHTPTKRGFQTYVGYLQAQGDYYNHNFALKEITGPLQGMDGLDFWHGTRPLFEAVGNYSLDIYRKSLTKVLNGYISRHDSPEKRAEHPLFIYLAHQTVHVPLQFRQDESSRCGKIKHAVRRIYCFMMVELDDAIGEMVEQYKSLGLWENLLIVALTDNGGMVNFNPNDKKENSPVFPASQGSNYPLRGSKMTLFDGGVRSTAFVSGGLVPSDVRGSRFKGLAHVVDLSATILSAAGMYPRRKEELKLDGVDLLGLLFGKKGAVQQRDHVPINVVSHGKRYSAVRFGRFKLIVDDFVSPPAQGWYDENGDLKEAAPPYVKGKLGLYDLEADPQERVDVSSKYPQAVQEGLDLIHMYVRGGDFMEPQASIKVHAKALPILHGGVWKPFMSEAAWTEQYLEDRARQKHAQYNVHLELDENVVSNWGPDERDVNAALA